jgi:hypothetical protein
VRGEFTDDVSETAVGYIMNIPIHDQWRWDLQRFPLTSEDGINSGVRNVVTSHTVQKPQSQ